MVNVGHARAADVLALIRKVRAAVKKVSGVKLELELKVVGEA
jgi:UDP-N-acetylmuramate dehydrogenase